MIGTQEPVHVGAVIRFDANQQHVLLGSELYLAMKLIDQRPQPRRRVPAQCLRVSSNPGSRPGRKTTLAVRFTLPGLENVTSTGLDRRRTHRAIRPGHFLPRHGGRWRLSDAQTSLKKLATGRRWLSSFETSAFSSTRGREVQRLCSHFKIFN